MPRRPATSGYARIAQAEEEEEEDSQFLSDDEYGPTHDHVLSTPTAQYASIQPKRRERMQAFGNYSPSSQTTPVKGRRRQRRNSGVDIKAINARLERWAEEIADKFKRRKVTGKTADEEHLEIHYSVFQPADGIRPVSDEAAFPETPIDPDRISKLEFDDLVEKVRVAIEQGVQPKLISQGSSGSYFARIPNGNVVGVFKPKDEEPYASKNPKWTKWIHRNLFPFAFGRACLIPNLSYVSEAAAYVLDTRLRTNLVPYTDVVSLSSRSFFYDFWERRAFHSSKKALPEKPGSFQAFLKGFRDANLFLKEHPWPEQTSTRAAAAHIKRSQSGWGQDCRPRSAPNTDAGLYMAANQADGGNAGGDPQQNVFWTPELQQAFREQLEKLVILDYIMRNTDRGLDNWMIRIDEVKGETDAATYQRHEAMTMDGAGEQQRASPASRVKVSIGAIDNSLSWPWKHPDAWRSFPFGWLFLPVSLIGRPFSSATREHFLPLLTSKHWWTETQVALRRCFELDSDFSEKMFARQMAVMKGQAWNVVETLKTPDHGPLELTRRARVCVWDDIVEIPVATPMRAPSSDVRRQQYTTPTKAPQARVQEEEMDISSALEVDSPQQPDLLGLLNGNSNGNLGTPVRKSQFNLSRQTSHQEGPLGEDNAPLSPSSINGFATDEGTKERGGKRPAGVRTNTGRLSMDDARRLFDGLGQHRRRFSLGLVSTPRRPTFGSQDDLEGDLGYAAAEHQEGNRRRVIVERLETVKSRNPVFTWC